MDIRTTLQERFIRYLSVTSQSRFGQSAVPSTEGQAHLVNKLHRELVAMGVTDCLVSEHSILTARIPANASAASIGFVAHVDTVDVGLSPDIKPQLLHYTGQKIVLNDKLGILFDKQAHPEIDRYRGDDIFFSDGTSVLGADDKAAIAIIMTLVEKLMTTDMPHGEIHIAFVPDEEVGLKGAKKIDLARFNPDYAYTLDCCELGEVVYETFNAAHARIDIKGVTAHPMSAKGVLVNPLLVANHIINQFDPLATPEHTSEREGYVWFTDLTANASEATLLIAIRDHDKKQFEEKKQALKEAVHQTGKTYPRAEITCDIDDTYANIANNVDASHPAIKAIYRAFEQLNIKPLTLAMRGGTDGSALSARGLVTPNYFVGAHNFHTRYEFLPMSSFESSYRVTEQLIKHSIDSDQ